jgi:hypothetical protein
VPFRIQASPRCPDVLAGCAVEQTNLITAITKLVLAGEQAGFTIEQMIQLLQTGTSLEVLLSMIEWRLLPGASEPCSSPWMM